MCKLKLSGYYSVWERNTVREEYIELFLGDWIVVR